MKFPKITLKTKFPSQMLSQSPREGLPEDSPLFPTVLIISSLFIWFDFLSVVFIYFWKPFTWFYHICKKDLAYAIFRDNFKNTTKKISLKMGERDPFLQNKLRFLLVMVGFGVCVWRKCGGGSILLRKSPQTFLVNSARPCPLLNRLVHPLCLNIICRRNGSERKHWPQFHPLS